SYRVTELAYEHMNNPRLIEVEPEQVTAERVEEAVYYPAMDEKVPLLLGLLRSQQPERSIVFVNTKRAADKVWGYLESNGFPAALLSGDVPQRKRQTLLERFTEGEVKVLVATDVAARGLHVPGISHVFNYDLPQDSEDYVHRIGRTARAGASGNAISFACEEYAFSLMEIQEYIGHKIPAESIDHEILVTDLEPPVKPERKPRPAGRGGPKGKGGGRPGGRSGDGRGRGGGGGGRGRGGGRPRG
ncbi:MAG TPA: helicase-related protein, partial [Gammaproteobacteria bacterium]|nr:helicase-related protein [Gammaproteobacteria bacterium]